MKNNKYKWMWITIIVLAVFNIVPLSILWINNQHSQRYDRGSKMFNFIDQELNLSYSQKNIFQNERKAHFSKTRCLSDSMRHEKQEINKLLFASTVDSAMIKQHIARIAQLQTTLEWLTYQHFVKLKNACSPEQRIKFEAAMQEMFNRRDREMGGQSPKGRDSLKHP